MTEKIDHDEIAEKAWREILMFGDLEKQRQLRRIYKLLPKGPRCLHCNAPFSGIGGLIVKLISDIRPSSLNPRYCNDCETFAKKHPGGAEVELAMLFADVRGSTTLAEGMNVKEFSTLIERFYKETSKVLIYSDALIEKLIGDELAALYVPGYAGPEYTRRAVKAAQKLLKVTGHRDRRGPWIPVGVGVHKGTAFVGAIGSKDGVIEITALGDAVNITARLCQVAQPGEIIVSEEAFLASGMDDENVENRQLLLKGRNEPVNVRVFHVQPI
jgi:adenylate cyclase